MTNDLLPGKYRLLPDVVLKSVCGEYLLVAAGSSRSRVGDLRPVNGTGAYFWRLLEQGMPAGEIVSRAERDFGISPGLARRAFSVFFRELARIGYLTEDSE